MNDEGYKTSPVVGYVRSAKFNDPQLDEWEAQIRAYAVERGYNLVAVLREEGVSGVAAHRPLLEKLIWELGEGKYVGVLAPNIYHLGAEPIKSRRVVTQIIQAGGWFGDLKI